MITMEKKKKKTTPRARVATQREEAMVKEAGDRKTNSCK
jgi:hypothetical protein